MDIITVDIETLKYDPNNARTHDDKNLDAIGGSLEEFGQVEPLVVQKGTGKVIGGNGRLAVLKRQGANTVEIVEVDLDDQRATALGLALNRTAELASWDIKTLEELTGELNDFDLGSIGFSLDDVEGIQDGSFFGDDFDGAHEDEAIEEAPSRLADRFIIPPFSVLDTRQGYWQDRKRAWLSLGIQSELGRGNNLLKFSPTVLAAQNGKHRAWGEKYEGGADAWANTGTSIFDPVLCELAYRWFSPAGGRVLDPFAGGSVRGLMAALTGRRYFGVDLRKEQVEENRKQAAKICGERKLKAPEWNVGNSVHMNSIVTDGRFDFVFSCPPYFDLEQYSDDPKDLSNMDYDEFLDSYYKIIEASVSKLKDDRFACFVISDIREKKGGGFYRGLVFETMRAFSKAGADLYNEAILLNSAGSLAIRVGKQFSGSRKLGRCHQNVLVFCKGDPVKATEACGEVEVEVPEPLENSTNAHD
ncbi:chromosome partitioning protein ParB [Candidatus Pacearchaeota archaeon]|nr:chromosome partitioning protein ParB [Candidatus Pacearchaeota archaeon]|tara:strand:+ start:124 stop:1542 length:1419 start_codon:yes stop_codon:yes gene_type:complete